MLPKSRQQLVFDTIDLIARQTSLVEVSNTFGAVMAKFGFTALGVTGLPPPIEGADPHVLSEKAPEGFRDLYIRERFYLVDHLGAYARTTAEVFRYCDAPYDRTESRDHERFMQALEAFGLGKGLIVPVGRPRSLPACVWLAGEDPALDEDAKRAAEIIALFAARKAYALSGIPGNARTANLTPREREALQWIAAGKTSWEASVILRVSEKAIDKIIASAMVKLDAVTRAQAVANAIRVGEVEL